MTCLISCDLMEKGEGKPVDESDDKSEVKRQVKRTEKRYVMTQQKTCEENSEENQPTICVGRLDQSLFYQDK